jgi:hypothetical protein
MFGCSVETEMDVRMKKEDAQFPEVIRGFVVSADDDGQHRGHLFSGIISGDRRKQNDKDWL